MLAQHKARQTDRQIVTDTYILPQCDHLPLAENSRAKHDGIMINECLCI